ncbi:MAG TPA: histidine phosphatase family protein [Chloroflexota bacterium]|nr:histidine phosphatase family protein [Chloroflexota bacterium]
MTTLLLIRHGETDWNVDGRYTGQSDIPLNDTGRAQARQAAAQLADNPPDVVISSDLERARETAEIIAAAFHLPVFTDPRLREINQGVWEGMYFADIKAKYTAEFAAREADPLSVAPPGGETVGQVRERVLTAVADIRQQYPGQRVAVVAHGLALALIKAEATNHPITQVWDLIPPNAQVEEVVSVIRDA